MKTELERFYRQQTFLLELSSVAEEVEESPYAWLPPHLWPKPEAPKQSDEDRSATWTRTHPEDGVRAPLEDFTAEYQLKDLRQLALATNGASANYFEVTYASVEEADYCAAEGLSDEVWTHIDPNEPESLCAQAFATGSFTPEDAAELRDLVLAEVGEWKGDETLLGEIEYLSAAGQMTRLARRKLEESAEHTDLLSALVERCQEYIGYRTEYLSAIGLL